MVIAHKVPRSFGTHDGTFHADEITACALLLLFDLIDLDKIFRTRNQEELDRCEYVCDVGGIYDPKRKLFDHHQVDYKGSLSSAGMILQYLFDSGIITAQERDFFDHSLIMGVDAHDNGRELHGKGVSTYSHIISNFTPIHYDVDPGEQDAAFFDALIFAKKHLERLWHRYNYIRSCQKIVSEVMSRDKECLMFEEGVPWLEIFFELEGARHPAKFLIMPSGKHWKLRGIPPTMDEKMKVRVPLPLEWAGLLSDELRKVSGIEGAVFCHKGRFISVWETREAAIKALEYTLRKGR